MSSTTTNNNQITCIYAGGTKFSDQLEAFLESSKKDIHPIDIIKTMPSDTLWHDIAVRLDISLEDLLTTESISNIDDNTSFSEESLVKILAKNPKALKGAIVMENDRIAHLTRYTEVLEFYDVDSAGLEKTFHMEEPVTQRQSNGDSFI